MDLLVLLGILEAWPQTASPRRRHLTLPDGQPAGRPD
jgi:hypothetical protein